MSNLTAEDIANAMEDKEVIKALGLGPPNPFDAIKTNEIVSDPQLNQKLMTPEWNSSKLTLMQPRIRAEKCWVPKTGEDGEPMMFEGKAVVEEAEVKFFDSFEKKEIVLPIDNIFKVDMRTSLLRPDDRNMLQTFIDLVFFIVQESIATGEDFSYDLYNITQKIGSILNISPSLGGKGAELLKTQITKGEQTNVIRQMLLQDQQHKGLFGMFKKPQT